MHVSQVNPPVTVDASQRTPAQSTPSISDVSHPAKKAKLVSRPFLRYHCRHWNISTFSYSVAGFVITDYDKTFQLEKSRF